jgi:hypothetical protein
LRVLPRDLPCQQATGYQHRITFLGGHHELASEQLPRVHRVVSLLKLKVDHFNQIDEVLWLGIVHPQVLEIP